MTLILVLNLRLGNQGQKEKSGCHHRTPWASLVWTASLSRVHLRNVSQGTL